MRNLQLIHSLKVVPRSPLAGTQALCIDLNTKTVYCATESGICGVNTATQEVTLEVSLADAGYLPPGGDVSVVGMEHLSDQTSVCLATSRGDLVLWNSITGDLECVGSVDHGLTAMSWSSDQELLILATGQNTLIMMTREFDPITEEPIFSDQFGAAEFVNVGWGKKETQFHGTEGKEAARKKAETVQPATEWDDRRPRICWHGDGQYFVVSAIHPQTDSRRLCVWTRDGARFSTSEPVSGVEQALGWKSNGNLITTSQRKPNKHDIIFFEKNGLRHGEFTLPFGVQDVKVREVLWNTESTVLAIWLEDLPKHGSTNVQSHIQLWTVNNYHWYLKQSLRYPEGMAVATLTWDQENPLRLHVVCRDGPYFQYTWAWTTHCSHGNTAADLTNVAVIDGAHVLMTPFRQAVVPPPLAAYQLEMSAAVNQVVFAPPSSPNDLALLMDNNTLAVFTFAEGGDSGKKSDCVQVKACGGNGFTVKCSTPRLQGIYSLEAEDTHPYRFYHVTWVRSNQLLMSCLSDTGSVSQLVRVQLNQGENKCQVMSTVGLEGYLYNIAVSDETGHIASQLTDGTMLKYDPDDDSVLPWVTDSGVELSYNAWKLCTQMDVTSIGGEEVVIGLTDRYQLYVNNTEVATNCTSYAIHDEFLLLTTYAHTCRCICRKTALKVLPSLSDGKAHPFDESIRRVERGSRIVAVVTDDTKLVLQMPRGNLETIHPRALVLSAVRRHLDRLQFKEAFTVMRKHRINMNLMYDHSPKNFLDNIDQFVLQVAAPSLINQFLTDLQEEDVTKTMYTAAYNQESVTLTDSPKVKANKVDKICDSLRLALHRIDSDKYLLSILTAYVRKSSPELDTALKLVKELKGRASPGSISPEEALKYLLFLVDVNELYDIALGTYDFDLVLLVAEKSQKDPKEYIPFLNSLRQMEESYRQYSIDSHLKRYTSALGNIVKCGDAYFNECLTLIKEQRLYREALALYQANSSQYKEIAVEYGTYLLEKKHAEEAGVVLSKAEQWLPALDAFQQASNWRMAVCMAYKAGYHGNSMDELCRKLAESLKAQNRHSEAAVLYEQHLNDIEEAIATLVEGSQWEESLRLMHKYGRLDFIDTHFSVALVESQTNYLSLLSAVHEEFEKHKNRLAVVRAQKEKARLEFLEGGEPNTADADLYSDTSSATGESAISGRSGSQVSADSRASSVFSKKSGRSAKTRRKYERKKWSLKEGSKHEDIALIETLSKAVKQAEEWKGDISVLLRMLMMFHYQHEAEVLQQKFDTLLTLLEASIPDIWPEETADGEGTSLPMLGPHSTANTIAQAVQQGRAPGLVSDVKIDPSLKVPPAFTKDNKWKLHCSDLTNR